ncbi:MAG: DDE-type integrase/transposase/recombinase [Planctomycetota bacterium]
MSQAKAAAVLGLSGRTLERWQRGAEAPTPRGRRRPWNALLPEERAIIAEVVARRDGADLSCRALSFWVLEHSGRYISPVAFWRYLKARKASQARVRRPRRPAGPRPDTTFALKPNDLWCWDITHLRTVVPWQFLYLYVVLDWVSRKGIAWLLAETLDSRTVLELWDRGLQNEGILELPKYLYPRSLSDRGPQMRSHLTRRFFARTGIEPLYTRPRTPNDNPEIEAFFSTMKGRPDYPGRFEGSAHAQTWCEQFFRWYNDEHHHRGLAYVTPSQRHAGLHEQVLAERAVFKARCLEERRKFNLNRAPSPAIDATQLV